MMKRATLFAAIASVCLVIYSFRNKPENGITFDTSTEKMKGVCWVAGDSITTHNIEQLTEIGANWISQTPFGWMSDYQSPEVGMNTERAWWGEADRGLKHTTILAKQQGVKTMLKPHIWLRGRDGKWRSDIAMNNEAEWNEWFKNYSNFILHYARLAEEYKMESLCIGTELQQTTKQRPEQWRKLIADIRQVYNGQLTYAANWYKEYEDITFWDDLDYIGIQAYFPLTKKNNPNKEQLVRSWTKHKKDIEKVAKRFGKRVVFTEIGYKNTSDAAIEPWSWPQQMDPEKTQISDQTQLACYQALFESVWDEEWMDGIFIWKWFHSTHKHRSFDTYFAERFERRKQRAERRGRELGPAVYFSPQMFPAKNELKKWYLEKA